VCRGSGTQPAPFPLPLGLPRSTLTLRGLWRPCAHGAAAMHRLPRPTHTATSRHCLAVVGVAFARCHRGCADTFDRLAIHACPHSLLHMWTSRHQPSKFHLVSPIGVLAYARRHANPHAETGLSLMSHPSTCVFLQRAQPAESRMSHPSTCICWQSAQPAVANLIVSVRQHRLSEAQLQWHRRRHRYHCQYYRALASWRGRPGCACAVDVHMHVDVYVFEFKFDVSGTLK
jgi:hypothetical protein